MNGCENLSQSEWNELANLELVREYLGLEPDDDATSPAAYAVGAKFPSYFAADFGFLGELFLIQGPELARPLQVVRSADGKLHVITRSHQ